MTEIHERTVTAKDPEFLDDIDDSELVSGKFFKKSDFVNGMNLVIIGVARSTFSDKKPKFDLTLQTIEGEEKVLTVGAKQIKELKAIFGKVSDWQWEKVHVIAKPDKWQIRGKETDGYNLEFTRL